MTSAEFILYKGAIYQKVQEYIPAVYDSQFIKEFKGRMAAGGSEEEEEEPEPAAADVAPETKVTLEDPDDEKKKYLHKQDYDLGKLAALLNAGWKLKDLMVEFGFTYKTQLYYLRDYYLVKDEKTGKWSVKPNAKVEE